jgi:hypothetical protein
MEAQLRSDIDVPMDVAAPIYGKLTKTEFACLNYYPTLEKIHSNANSSKSTCTQTLPRSTTPSRTQGTKEACQRSVVKSYVTGEA